MSTFKLIDAERANYPVAMLCRALGVSKSGYYAWRSRPPSQRRRQNTLLTEKIREIHSRSRETYGYPRIHAELHSLGIGCGRRRVGEVSAFRLDMFSASKARVTVEGPNTLLPG